MNVEFHYYVIHFLASQAGTPEDLAKIIAYSSQYVDNNIVAYAIDTGTEIYQTTVTQNYGWWDASFPRNVYLPFHFFPGGNDTSSQTRIDGRRNPLNCIPNSPGVKELLIRALKTRNPYRVGIGLHTFADSWAHQNFSGALEDWNTLAEESPIPSIGHAQALTTPDDFTATWTDPRLTYPASHVDNRVRFRQAATKIYKYLCVFNRRPFDDADNIVQRLISEYISPANEKSLQERLLDFVIEADIPEYDRREWIQESVIIGNEPLDEELFSGYSKLLWLTDALLYRTRLLERNRLTARSYFYKSHLYYWNEAAKAHLRDAHAICSQLPRMP